MNKSELVAKIAQKTGLSKKDSEKALNACVESVTEALVAGDRVHMFGFGVFEVKERKAHVGRNPRTKETIEIPASKNLQFKASRVLKEAINK